MRPQLTISHEGTLGTADRHRFGFHQASIAHIMRVLTDLYEDPQLAVIREYSNNARDAHIAAGKADVPIQITAPTQFESTFIVRDDGLGLSKAELVENLTLYGYSSKRDNDEETGMLGLGSKSALTYTSQFSYVACKDGKTVTVLITREDDGAPVLQVVDEIDTPEQGNFVEVHIPVKDAATFTAKIEKFFWVWEKGTVLINGQQPASIWDDIDPDYENDPKREYLWLSPDVVLIPTGNHGYYGSTEKSISIVQGGVTYRVGTETWDREIVDALRNWRTYVFVDVGTVDFTPNRESIMETKRTKECLKLLGEYIHERLEPTLQKMLNEMTFKDARQWILQRQDLARWMFKAGTPLKWSGRILTFEHRMEIPTECRPAWVVSAFVSSYDSDRAQEESRIQFTSPPIAIVHGYKRTGSVPGDHKDQIRSGLRKLYPGVMYPGVMPNGRVYNKNDILLVAKPLPQSMLEMIGEPPQVAFTDLYSKAKSERASSRALETRYRMVNTDSLNVSGWKDVHELEYHPDAYLYADDYRQSLYRERAQSLAMAGHRIALVWKRNEKWFLENHADVPTVRKYVEWFATERVPEMMSQLGDIGRHRLHVCQNDNCSEFSSWVGRIGDRIDLIDDPELHEVARIVVASKKPSPTVDKLVNSKRILERFGFNVNLGVRSAVCEQTTQLMRKYRILGWVEPRRLHHGEMDELVRIINLVYAPPVPSTAMVLWNSPSNPNHPKVAYPTCVHRHVTPTTKTNEGVLL